MNSINIKGLSKRAVLQALYSQAGSPGMGILHRRNEPLSDADADAALASETYFDYLHGRVMKVDLGGDTLDPRLYDRDNGHGAAARALAPLLSGREG